MASYSVPGFHSNDSARCERFLKEDSFIIVCTTDTEFLGTGMYFWGTESEARRWKVEQDKEMIVKASLNLDNLLDLTDQEMVEGVTRTLERFDALKYISRDDPRRKYLKSMKNAPGISLDAIFQAFPDYYGQFNIIKGRQYSPKREESEFFFGSRLTIKAIDIYCARNAEPISEREKVAV